MEPGIVGVLVAVAGRWAYRRLVAGDLAVDLSIRRTVRPLGPQDEPVAAPKDLVFGVIAAPYLALAAIVGCRVSGCLSALRRWSSRPTGPRSGGAMVAATVETVRFERPVAVHFRLVRGPVPLVAERFELTEDGDGTLFHCEGELGADLWVVGR